MIETINSAFSYALYIVAFLCAFAFLLGILGVLAVVVFFTASEALAGILERLRPRKEQTPPETGGLN